MKSKQRNKILNMSKEQLLRSLIRKFPNIKLNGDEHEGILDINVPEKGALMLECLFDELHGDDSFDDTREDLELFIRTEKVLVHDFTPGLRTREALTPEGKVSIMLIKALRKAYNLDDLLEEGK